MSLEGAIASLRELAVNLECRISALERKTWSAQTTCPNPRPTMDWSALPKWANKWIAADSTGYWYGYRARPRVDETEGEWEWTGDDAVHIPPAFAPTWQGDWKDSLTEAPQMSKQSDVYDILMKLADEVATWWNDASTMVNQKAQVQRLAEILRSKAKDYR